MYQKFMLLFFSILTIQLIPACLPIAPNRLMVVGQCVIQIDARSLASEKSQQNIYKIDKKIQSKYQISTWYQGKWMYSNIKPENYFNDSESFKYKFTTCPLLE
jgi:hypothetical protein